MCVVIYIYAIYGIYFYTEKLSNNTDASKLEKNIGLLPFTAIHRVGDFFYSKYKWY